MGDDPSLAVEPPSGVDPPLTVEPSVGADSSVKVDPAEEDTSVNDDPDDRFVAESLVVEGQLEETTTEDSTLTVSTGTII